MHALYQIYVYRCSLEKHYTHVIKRYTHDNYYMSISNSNDAVL